MKARIVAVLVTLFGTGFCLLRAYSVEPHSAQHSGWTHGEDGYVSEILTINFDELDSTSGAYCELFAGSRGAGGAYHVSVLTYPGGSPVASGNAEGNVDHQWVKINLGVDYPDSIVKGKQLEFRFSRTSDSIMYYFRDSANGGPYKYGQMIVGGTPQANRDLACRVHGRMNPVDTMSFACDEAWWWSSDGYVPDGAVLAARASEARVKAVRLDLDWHLVQWDSPDSWHFTLLDSSLRTLAISAGCQILALLTNVPNWASTRIDTVWRYLPDTTGTDSTYQPVLDSCIYCAPKGLQYAFNSDSNYLGELGTFPHLCVMQSLLVRLDN